MPHGKRRPQLTDVAACAGVSIATVDRVMNRRKGVSDRTRRRVLAAACDIGYLTREEAARIGAERPDERYRPASGGEQSLPAASG